MTMIWIIVHSGSPKCAIPACGEAQRVKLAEELSKRSTGRTLYIFGEPTTGLHFEDVKNLPGVLHRLVDRRNRRFSIHDFRAGSAPWT